MFMTRILLTLHKIYGLDVDLCMLYILNIKTTHKDVRRHYYTENNKNKINEIIKLQ